jgi:hypothetical protein
MKNYHEAESRPENRAFLQSPSIVYLLITRSYATLMAWAKVGAGPLSAVARPHRELDVVDQVGFFPLNRLDAVRVDPRSEYLTY